MEAGLALAGFPDIENLAAFVRTPSTDPERLRDRSLIEAPGSRAAFHRPAAPVVDAARVVAATAHVVGMEPARLRSWRRSWWHVFARQVAVIAADGLGLSGAQIATALGLTRGDIDAAAGQVVFRLAGGCSSSLG